MKFNTNIKTISLAAILLLSLSLFATNPKKVTVEIDFGGIAENITKELLFEKDITALEALLNAAKVQTHPAGGYVFVDGIEDIFNEKGKNAWYYKINNEFATELAIKQELKKGDVVTWIYKQDVCSRTIDANTSATKKSNPSTSSETNPETSGQ